MALSPSSSVGGGGTQYAEDTPHSTGDLVTAAGVVQQAADAALSGDGDYSALQVDPSGFLKVNVKAGSGGGVSHTDDSPFTPGVSAEVPAAAMFDDVAPDSVDEGDAGVLRMSANRNLYSTIRDAAGNERGANVSAGNALLVDGSAVTQPVSGTVSVTEPVSVDDNGGSLTVDGTVTADTELPAAAALADAAGNPTAPAVGAFGLVWNGATWDRAPGDTAGQFAQGNVAHDAVDAGNPLLNGARAIAHGANPTAVAAADRTVLYANRAGVLFTIGGHPNALTLEFAWTATQTDIAIVTVAGGLKIVVVRIAVSMDKANTVNVNYRIGFGAANTPTTTGVVASHPGMVPGGGERQGDGAGILGIGADGEDLRITASVPTTGSARAVVTYYTIES